MCNIQGSFYNFFRVFEKILNTTLDSDRSLSIAGDEFIPRDKDNKIPQLYIIKKDVELKMKDLISKINPNV